VKRLHRLVVEARLPVATGHVGDCLA
jgi:hypothetical protein